MILFLALIKNKRKKLTCIEKLYTVGIMEEVITQMEDLLKGIEEGIKEGKFPEISRIYIEHLGRNIRTTLRVLRAVTRENTIQTGISPSSRSAMYNLRRAFYAVIGRLAKEQGVDKNRSAQEWRKAASKLIEEIGKAGISEAPMKIVLSYDIIEEDGVKYMKLEKAEILYFELEGLLEINLK